LAPSKFAAPSLFLAAWAISLLTLVDRGQAGVQVGGDAVDAGLEGHEGVVPAALELALQWLRGRGQALDQTAEVLGLATRLLGQGAKRVLAHAPTLSTHDCCPSEVMVPAADSPP
jgi:hypothetical protein